MQKYSILFYIFIAFLLLVCLRIYYESDAFNLKCIIASKDGNRYCADRQDVGSCTMIDLQGNLPCRGEH